MSFIFDTEHILENENVRLTPLAKEDLAHLKRFALNEPHLWQHSLVPADSEERMQNYINLAIQARENKTAYAFAIYDKTKQTYAGSTRFYDIQPESSCVQLGYTWYGSQFQRTGLNRHCKFLMLAFIFDTLGMHRVEFRADHDNKQSITAMKGIGCTAEGVLRSNGFRTDGSRRNSIVLSILKDEWDSRLREGLRLKCRPVM
ncbi:MAG: GNAT family N-acetyltransferase [Flavobacteriales bacterium]